MCSILSMFSSVTVEELLTLCCYYRAINTWLLSHDCCYYRPTTGILAWLSPNSNQERTCSDSLWSLVIQPEELL